MKTSFIPFRLLILLAPLLLSFVPTEAVIFTNDISIGVTNTGFDQQDIIATNCTVTVDGPHAFASVRLLNGSVLTHSFATNAILRGDFISIANELHTLSSTNPVVLNHTNVRFFTVVVSSLTGVTYQPGADYGLIATNEFTSTPLPPTPSAPPPA